MNIIYKSSDINNELLLDTLKLWNDEVGLVYPIPLKAFKQNVINYQDKDCLLAFDDNKLIGFIILKRFDNNLFISLFYVSKNYRNKGIGSSLIDFAKEKKKNLVIGKDIDNFFPGVPTDFDNLTDVWLEKRGFKGVRYTHDLISYNPISKDLINKNVKYVVCDKTRYNDLISFIENNKWSRWAYEAKEYFESDAIDKDCFIIGLLDNKIVSFVRINTFKNNYVTYNVLWQNKFKALGGIGPLGVDKDYRKRGLGIDIVSVAIDCLRKKGCKEMIIDWTGLMEFYRNFGFEVYKSYKYMSLDI